MFKSIFRLGKQTFQEYSEDRVPILAAALAYYTMFSLAPLLVVVVAVAGTFFDQAEARQMILSRARVLLGPEGVEFLAQMMENARRDEGGIIATVVGLVAILFGATGILAALQEALNRIWGATTPVSNGILDFVRRRFLSLTLILGIGFLLLASLVIRTVIAIFDDWIHLYVPGSEIILQVINWVVALGVITVLFAMIFKILPDVQIRWRDVWVGAFVTAVLFNLGTYALGLYFQYSAVGSAYGAAGSLALLLIWVFYSSQVLLIGGEFTQVYARWRGVPFLPHKPKKDETEQDAVTDTDARRGERRRTASAEGELA